MCQIIMLRFKKYSILFVSYTSIKVKKNKMHKSQNTPSKMYKFYSQIIHRIKNQEDLKQWKKIIGDDIDIMEMIELSNRILKQPS